MKQPAIQRFRHNGCRERGVTMVLVAVAMVAIIAIAALSIDVITLYLAREEAQRSADAAALAAARVISISGMTGDPNNTLSPTSSWQLICGPGGIATQAATAVATQSAVGSSVPTTVNVTYSAGGQAGPDCSGFTAGGAFGVNPIITVQVARTRLPTFFSRIWGNSSNTVSATATTEAFNPSNSGNVGNSPTGIITPVQPRCVKPWLVPNRDPLNPQQTSGKYCAQAGGPGACATLVSTTDGSITNKGISLNGTNTNGVIGETFWLSPDCNHTGAACSLRQPQPGANYVRAGFVQGPPNLQFVPGPAPPSAPVAVPSCAALQDWYQQSTAGCDQSTPYQCGVQVGNTVDLNLNPDIDTAEAVQCLIREATPNTLSDGQDALNTTAYPFQILAGTSNPLVATGLASGSAISTSNSIVSLPIYDDAVTINGNGTTSVTVVGFLQVFINSFDPWGNVNVTVLNVAGCGNGLGNTVGSPVAGSSPVPVRLITPP
jgi:hypothetical protein